MNNLTENRIKGALYGVAVGDALGAPLEFLSANQIKSKYGVVKDMIGGGWLNVRPGETTDDTAMTLAVAEGIIENPDHPISAIGERFIKWAYGGPKDIGTTCHGAIDRAAAKSCEPTEGDWISAARETAAANGGKSGGNGALMRAIYPPLYYTDKEKALDIEERQGCMTHYDKESIRACRLYGEIIYDLVNEKPNKRGILRFDKTELKSFLVPTIYNVKNIERKEERIGLKPTGWVVESLECVVFAFFIGTNSFEEAVTKAVNLGGDADTIGAICGGLAGAYYGFEAIPKRWLSCLSAFDTKRIEKAVTAAVKNHSKKE